MVKEFINGVAGGFSLADQYGYTTYPFNVVWQNGGVFYFTANKDATAPGGSYANDVELWKSDGTDAGTTLVKDIYTGTLNSSYPTDFNYINGSLYFTAYNNTSGRELWKTDGTTGGTVLVKEIVSGNVGGFQTAEQYGYYTLPFVSTFSVNGYFYFVANDNPQNPGSSYTNNLEIWKSDGTDAGTSKVMEIYPGNTYGCNAEYFSKALNKVFFTAYDPTNGREIWYIDNATPSAIEEMPNAINLSVFPNPTNDVVSVMVTSENLNPEEINFTLTDLSGRVISSSNDKISGGRLNQSIDMSSLSTGLYILHVTGENWSKVKKVVKE